MEETGQLGEAVAQWRALVTRLGQVTGAAVRNKLAAFQQLGRVLENHQQDGVAEETLNNRWSFPPLSLKSFSIGSRCGSGNANGPWSKAGTMRRRRR